MKESKALAKATTMIELVEKLCSELTECLNTKYPHTLKENEHYNYSIGRKYIKIISCSGSGQSVWGFINVNEFTKVRKMERVDGIVIKEVTFKEGDILMSAGWNTPALNAPRGNIFQNYNVSTGNMFGPTYLV